MSDKKDTQKTRVDLLLVEKKLVESRSKAQGLIMAGHVECEVLNSKGQLVWKRVDKAGELYTIETPLRLIQVNNDVSRGALKLRKAYEEWPELRNVTEGALALDVGSSTGGFTQVLLEKGAARVVALDVGTHQLHEKLRKDSRVLSLEKTHVLKIDAEFFKAQGVSLPFGVASMDVSFISSTRVIPQVAPWLASGAFWVILVKPQFELEAKKLSKGIVKSEAYRKEALDNVISLARDLDCFSIEGHCESPISGTDGNVEYLLCLKKK